MKRYAVLGAGLMGQAVVEDLLQTEADAAVTLLDSSDDRLKEAALLIEAHQGPFPESVIRLRAEEHFLFSVPVQVFHQKGGEKGPFVVSIRPFGLEVPLVMAFFLEPLEACVVPPELTAAAVQDDQL